MKKRYDKKLIFPKHSKKRLFISILLITLLISTVVYIQYFYFGKDIKSISKEDKVTGGAIESNLAVAISVTGPPPLNIVRPINGTFITGENLTLEFISNGETIWYNINQTSNITITENTIFNASEGTNTLYLFANNTYGTTSKNITFTVNTTKLIIKYDKYKEKGSSKDFNKFTFEEIQNLSGIILEIPEHGKISFNQPINFTNDVNPNDGFVDIDSNTNISFNKIEINTTALPNFNKSATIYLYNLTFNNPRILKDGVVCPESICSIQSYSSGTLVFNVSHFTVYSAEETPDDSPAPGYSPTGGGRSITTTKSFDINMGEITVKLKQGETTRKEIIILNDGDSKLSFSLETTPSIENLIKMNKREFELAPSEAEIITLDFLASEETLPNYYLGKIIVKAEGIEKEILIGIEIITQKPLFDVKISLNERFMNSMPGEEIYYHIEIFNLEAVERAVDVIIEHRLLDMEGNEILSDHESVAVMTKTSYIKEIKLPENIPHGRYVLYVTTKYNGEVASSSIWFNVGKSSISHEGKIFILSLITLIIMIAFIVYSIISKKLNQFDESKKVDLSDMSA